MLRVFERVLVARIFLASIVSCGGPSEGDDGGLYHLCWGFDTNALRDEWTFPLLFRLEWRLPRWCFRRFVSCGRKRALFVCWFTKAATESKPVVSLCGNIEILFYDVNEEHLFWNKLLKIARTLFEERKKKKRLACLQNDISSFIFPLKVRSHLLYCYVFRYLVVTSVKNLSTSTHA